MLIYNDAASIHCEFTSYENSKAQAQFVTKHVVMQVLTFHAYFRELKKNKGIILPPSHDTTFFLKNLCILNKY